MQLLQSKQCDVPFAFCGNPLTIDKRADWGDDPANFQTAPDGAFLKLQKTAFPNATTLYLVTSLVHPNAEKSAPIGWMRGSEQGLFSKLPIWVDSANPLNEGDTVELATPDKKKVYTAKEPSLVCYNDLNGEPNLQDGWVQTIANVTKNYVY